MNAPVTYTFMGPAALMKFAYQGIDLTPLGNELIAGVEHLPPLAAADALMDLSTILQLNGNRDIALSVQSEALRSKQHYHLSAPHQPARIRLLAIMTPGDLMSNTPLDFLLEDSDISLDYLYLAPHLPFPETIPPHDVLFVAIAEADENRMFLEELGKALPDWPLPVLNRADRILNLARDRAHALLADIPGVAMPATVRQTRAELSALVNNQATLSKILPDADYPIVVRPVGSHAGRGLEKIDNPAALQIYLSAMSDEMFYLSPFIDYRNTDGLFRKFRVALIEGRPYAVHLGVSAHWMIHYMNAGMNESAEKRAEEEKFMAEFDTEFARKHASALQAIYERTGLDYLILDCAETPAGELLLFELDTSAVVHAMDPIDLYPYKQPQMRKVFAAFRNLLLHAMQKQQTA